MIPFINVSFLRATQPICEYMNAPGPQGAWFSPISNSPYYGQLVAFLRRDLPRGEVAM
jgi:hypothetical protein